MGNFFSDPFSSDLFTPSQLTPDPIAVGREKLVRQMSQEITTVNQQNLSAEEQRERTNEIILRYQPLFEEYNQKVYNRQRTPVSDSSTRLRPSYLVPPSMEKSSDELVSDPDSEPDSDPDHWDWEPVDPTSKN